MRTKERYCLEEKAMTQDSWGRLSRVSAQSLPPALQSSSALPASLWLPMPTDALQYDTEESEHALLQV